MVNSYVSIITALLQRLSRSQDINKLIYQALPIYLYSLVQRSPCYKKKVTKMEQKANQSTVKRRDADVGLHYRTFRSGRSIGRLVDRSVGFHLSYMLASSWNHISRLMVITIYHPGAGTCAYMRAELYHARVRNARLARSSSSSRGTGRASIMLFMGHTVNCSHLSPRDINLARDTNRPFK
jgi:hypothetical protein